MAPSLPLHCPHLYMAAFWAETKPGTTCVLCMGCPNKSMERPSPEQASIHAHHNRYSASILKENVLLLQCMPDRRLHLRILWATLQYNILFVAQTAINRRVCDSRWLEQGFGTTKCGTVQSKTPTPWPPFHKELPFYFKGVVKVVLFLNRFL